MKLGIISALCASLLSSSVDAKKQKPALYNVDFMYKHPLVAEDEGNEMVERSPKYEFEYKEMTRWIWEDKQYKSKKSLIREQEMWEMDLPMQRLRGII